VLFQASAAALVLAVTGIPPITILRRVPPVWVAGATGLSGGCRRSGWRVLPVWVAGATGLGCAGGTVDARRMAGRTSVEPGRRLMPDCCHARRAPVIAGELGELGC
jgi:hypothetical protein